MNEATIDRARDALSFLNPDCDRATWVKYGMCLKAEFGDHAFETWDSWSSNSDKYRASDARSTWRSIKADGKLTIGSLFYDAKQAGWKDDSKPKRLTAAELKARRDAAEERKARADAEEAAAHAAAAARALALWDAAKPCDDHPYLTRKGVSSYGLRVGRWERIDESTGEVITVTEQGLLIPIRDRQRRLWSLQCIDADPNRKKLYLKGGAKSGNFFSIGAKPLEVNGRTVIMLGEGYATCASVHAATGHMVLCCFDVSNLMAVAESLRAARPDVLIVMLADNDAGTEGNPGVTAANKVAARVGALVVVPPPGDFNDLQAAEGLEAVRAVIDASLDESVTAADPIEVAPPVNAAAAVNPEPPPPLPIESELESNGYFVVLGFDGDDYYFFVYSKLQVLARTRHDFTTGGLIELAPLNWWEANFPGGKAGANRDAAFEWAMNAAHARGIYDPRRIRGRGAWRDNNRTVFHHGSYLLVDGEQTHIAKLRSRWVYPLARSFPTVAGEALSDADGRHLFDTIRLARWKRPGSAALLAGWVFLAPICGALPWRPHVWITGPAGSGKTTVYSDYVQCLLEGIAEALNGDSSEPGIRQLVRADAVPILIDEFEPNEENDRKRMKSILTMIRQSSSETASLTAKGTVSGDGIRFQVRSMFCLASINLMIDKTSDSSRISVLELRSPAKSGSSDDHWPELQESLHQLRRDGSWPSRLLARGLAMLPTVLANVEVFCRVAAKHFGTQRVGDQYGTLLAGAWSLLSSTVATDAQAVALIESQDWTEHTDAADGMTDSDKALAAILEAKIRVGATDVTIHEVISVAAGTPTSTISVDALGAHDLLRRNGIRIEDTQLVFGVSTGHLRKLVENTSYATDIRGQLSRLPGASNLGNKTRKFNGTNSKCVAIPLAAVLDGNEDAI